MKTLNNLMEENCNNPPHYFKNSFCSKLKDLRDERKLSQKTVAENLGCPVSTYANWEQGRTEPSIYDIFNLLYVYNVEANELFDISVFPTQK